MMSNITVTEVFAVLLFISLKGQKMVEHDNPLLLIITTKKEITCTALIPIQGGHIPNIVWI